MAELLIRDLDDTALQRLQVRAKAARQSPEQAAREILAKALGAEPAVTDKAAAWAEIDRLRAMSKPSAVDSITLIRDFRDGDDAGH